MPARFPYGTVLKIQREHTLQDIGHSLLQIRRLGMNTVVIWPAVYWWEDANHPAYPFRTGQQILSIAEELGLQVIMELAGQITALEYAPDHAIKPDYYATHPDGSVDNRNPYYHYLNYNHPGVRDLVAANFQAAAAAYKDYPALYGYDILNETMFSSYDPYTLHRFREWLHAKYGSIGALNDAWERHYTHWNQVEYTTWLWASVMPFVDWQQFRKDNIGLVLNDWRAIIRAVDPDHPVIADNIHAMVSTDAFYERPHDDWTTAANVDEYGISFYPKNDLAGQSPVWRWQTFSGVRSATAGGRFRVSEMQSHHRNMYLPESIVEPHHLTWWAWEAIAHGAAGIVYWKWAPFHKGWQTGGRGLVNRRGELTPRAEAAAVIQRTIRKQEHAFLNYRPEQPRVAIYYDRLAHDFSKAFALGAPQHNSIYLDSIAGLYACLWSHNIPVDFITPDDVRHGNLDGYNAIFLTNQLNLSPRVGAGLGAYVTRGGTLICDGKWGEIDDNSALYRNSPGGPLNLLLGWDLEDIDPFELDFGVTWNGLTLDLPGYFERKRLVPRQNAPNPATVIGVFDDGAPAVLQATLRHGQMIYLATHLWYGFHHHRDAAIAEFMGELAHSLDFAPHAISNNRLKIATLRSGDNALLFVFNYERGERTATVQLYTLPPGDYAIRDLINDQELTLATESYAPSDVSPTLNVHVPSQGVSVFHLQRRPNTSDWR